MTGAAAYDVIVVGARCAGAPTAMLLARHGFRVLLVDRDRFPSDTMSTHLIHPPGIAALRRWGLLDAALATGCPPIDTYAFDFGPFVLAGSPGTEAEPVAYAPRRTSLDALLVEAAAGAGAEVRTGFNVTGLVREDERVVGVRGRGPGGAEVVERARVVVGADGLRSTVAREVSPDAYVDRAPLLVGYYSYFSDLPMSGRFEAYIRPERAFAAWPTAEGLTVVITGWPYAELTRHRETLEESWWASVDLAPAFAARLRAASQETRLVGTAVPNYFRTPYGPGWVLVGDAGYHRDFITAQGMQDAFAQAELCAERLAGHLDGAADFSEAMSDYQRRRDASVAGMFELTMMLASLEPPPPELGERLAAMAGDQAAMDLFARVNAGVESPEQVLGMDSAKDSA